VRGVAWVDLRFTSNGSGSLNYRFWYSEYPSRTIPITRQPISSGSVPGVSYTDLWWNPSESGWGLSVTQQGSVMFLAWFVYDDAGKPVWYVASNCAVNAAGTSCSGALYRTTGPALGATFNPASVRATEAGSVTLSFTDGNNGVLSYNVNGLAGSKAITRQLF
jgi:hypothetical protein